MPSFTPAPVAEVVLLTATPFDATIETVWSDWPLPCGDIGWPDENQFTTQGGETTVRAATQPFTTAPAHTPGDTFIGGHLTESFSYGTEAFSGTEPTGAAGSAGVGAIKLDDPDGDLDGWLNYAFDGRAIQLKRGAAGTDPDGWDVIANVTCDALLHDLSGKQLRMRDLQYRLYQSTFQKHRFGGTGGADGDANIAGAPQPMMFGRTFNPEPTLVNAGILVYRIHFRAMEEVTAVRDGGSALTFDADYPSYAALAAATVAGGFYATCLAEGFLKLGTKPTFGLRVDGKGDKFGGVYVETRGAIARRIATTVGDLPLGDPANVDTTAFSDFDIAQPAPCGLFLRELDARVGDVLDRWMAGCAGWWTVSLAGKMRVQVLESPDGAADFTLQYQPDTADDPVIVDRPPPRLETSIGWRRNWGPQDPATLAGSVTASDSRLYQDLWSYSDPTYGRNDALEPQHRAGRRVVVDGYFALQDDANDEADRQRTLFSTVRERWTVRVDMDAFTDVIGKIVEITGVNRMGWGASKKFRCIGIDAIASSETVRLSLWG